MQGQFHLWAGQVKRLMRYAMHKAADRLTPAPQCTSAAAQSQQLLILSHLQHSQNADTVVVWKVQPRVAHSTVHHLLLRLDPLL